MSSSIDVCSSTYNSNANNTSSRNQPCSATGLRSCGGAPAAAAKTCGNFSCDYRSLPTRHSAANNDNTEKMNNGGASTVVKLNSCLKNSDQQQQHTLKHYNASDSVGHNNAVGGDYHKRKCANSDSKLAPKSSADPAGALANC